MRQVRIAAASIAAIGLAACAAEEPAALPSSVYFFDAPLCSSIIPARFYIDGVLAGSDTFRVNLAPERLTSRAFQTSAGQHTLGARGSLGAPVDYVWPDTTVDLTAGGTLVHSLPLYCS
jgi:hypothetical protein